MLRFIHLITFLILGVLLPEVRAVSAPVGRLVNSGSQSFTWTDNDRMNSFSEGAVSQNYTYDSDGLRVQAGDKHYLYDMTLPYGQGIVDYNLDTVSYVYGNERISETRKGTGTNNETYYYLIDGQGSIRGLLDSTASVVGSRDYSAFGEVIAESGVVSDFGYTGEQTDDMSKLLYLRARWMNPAIGGFISMDPYGGCVSCPSTLTRYTYVEK